MGSRAVVDRLPGRGAARQRFGVAGGEDRHRLHPHRPAFFDDAALERAAARPRCATALTRPGFWDELETDWVCLDCELMPWSAKAQELLRDAVRRRRRRGAARRCREAVAALDRRPAAGDGATRRALLATLRTARSEHGDRFVAAYRHYCWPVASLDDLKLAPFHLLATRGRVSTSTATTSGTWRRSRSSCRGGARAAAGDAVPRRRPRPTRRARPTAIAWWEELTGRGGEGMVVKPLDFIARGKARAGPAGRQVPRAASTCASSTARSTRAGATWRGCARRGLAREALAGAARVRAGHRGAGALRPPRAAAPRARVRLRRAGPGERAGRPAVVTSLEPRRGGSQ